MVNWCVRNQRSFFAQGDLAAHQLKETLPALIADIRFQSLPRKGRNDFHSGCPSVLELSAYLDLNFKTAVDGVLFCAAVVSVNQMVTPVAVQFGIADVIFFA